MSIKNRNSGLSGEPLLQANMQCTNMASCCAFLGRLGEGWNPAPKTFNPQTKGVPCPSTPSSARSERLESEHGPSSRNMILRHVFTAEACRVTTPSSSSSRSQHENIPHGQLVSPSGYDLDNICNSCKLCSQGSCTYQTRT